MNDYLLQLSAAARHAVSRKDWTSVNVCAAEILRQDGASAEGHFLRGIIEKTSNRHEQAMTAFSTVLKLDAGRYDAAIELANQYSVMRRNSDAAAVVEEYENKLESSPLYLNMAGTVYSQIGMTEKAWPLFQKANELQPGIDRVQSNLGTCCVVLGKIDEAKRIYERLLERHPTHQQYHYKLALLDKAVNTSHIEQMKSVLRTTGLSPDKNVFLYYGIGKEFEDLAQWEDAFEYFKKAGDAISSVADYDINTDLRLIDKIIEVCDANWLADGAAVTQVGSGSKEPIFIVGLPRTGTTLADRIISSHSQVRSVGETQFMQMTLRRESGIESDEKMTPEMITASAKLDIGVVGDGYMNSLSYRLGDEPMFVDKLPFNILYLGFIAKAFPNARIVHMKRNPMDSCFSMYKQLFTWAYKFSYTQEGLGAFYPSYIRLVDHWRRVLGDRLIELEYESLVSDQENQTRILLSKLGLEFEEACLNFETSKTATATASFAQVREKIHTRSVDRWKNYKEQLRPLREALESAGIALE